MEAVAHVEVEAWLILLPGIKHSPLRGSPLRYCLAATALPQDISRNLSVSVVLDASFFREFKVPFG